MDRLMNLRHLQLAERHVLRGSQNIFAQEQHIEALECRGWDATLARAVLQTFVITQTQFVAHRDQILEALGRA